ncbi:hypothetical protein NDU88_001665 [Pleurodeles waltl]|uniref:Uncharacterized protein n=1 Tax=Pleurodeles waltl TaxID=8319 RepID=A0AAV7SDH7_PLEWA|nr:hypothetical protein NDU88_001665 [Pleurodeles waltl]
MGRRNNETTWEEANGKPIGGLKPTKQTQHQKTCCVAEAGDEAPQRKDLPSPIFSLHAHCAARVADKYRDASYTLQLSKLEPVAWKIPNKRMDDGRWTFLRKFQFQSQLVLK